MSLTDYSFVYHHFQKMRQLALGEGKSGFSVDIRCIGTSGKTARSVHPKVDLLPHRNVWKRGAAPGKNVPQLKRVCIPCILLLYVKRTISTPVGNYYTGSMDTGHGSGLQVGTHNETTRDGDPSNAIPQERGRGDH